VVRHAEKVIAEPVGEAGRFEHALGVAGVRVWT
jgi:hypothetical protein